jgi:hypothetical protein
MSNLTIKEINAETGEEIVRDMTDDEIAEYQAGQYAIAALEVALKAKEVARQSALEKLAALGITAEEAASLLS